MSHHGVSRTSLSSLVILYGAVLACSEDSRTPVELDPPDAHVPGTYVVSPPSGKLPLPGHDPRFDQTQYNAMVNSVTFVNTFGGYEGSGDGTRPYPTSPVTDWVHPGRDFMMQTGSPVFAVTAGLLRYVSGGGIDFEDLDNPGFGWSYGHVRRAPNLALGDTVFQGQYIGLVEDAHVCLVRVMLLPGRIWPQGLQAVHLDAYFDLPDTEPPQILGPLHYFKDASRVEIPRGSGPVLSGKVDIVAALRDTWGRPHTGIPERMAPAQFHVSVTDEQGTTRWSHEANMRMYAVPLPFFSPPEEVDHAVNLFFKRASLFTSEYWGFKGYMYYIVTNLPTRASLAPITERDDQLHWDTTLLPNGQYSVVLTVKDASGNTLVVRDEVQTAN